MNLTFRLSFSTAGPRADSSVTLILPYGRPVPALAPTVRAGPRRAQPNIEGSVCGPAENGRAERRAAMAGDRRQPLRPRPGLQQPAHPDGGGARGERVRGGGARARSERQAAARAPVQVES